MTPDDLIRDELNAQLTELGAALTSLAAEVITHLSGEDADAADQAMVRARASLARLRRTIEQG